MAAPAWMHPDEPELADGARARLQQLRKSRAVVSPSTSFNSNKGKAPKVMSEEANRPIFVEFKDTRERSSHDDHDRDLFSWAILYENQRGLTIFSTPYYSSRSLLPYDPPPFTVPDPGPSSSFLHPRNTPANVTPATYTLPDPTWRWVSKSWLIDMRSDGDVQHDGFEYNWFFRRKHWRARVGWFSAGGFVRRRRWVRLMLRPSDARRQAEATFDDCVRADVMRSPDPVEGPRLSIWRGDADDWSRVHAALKAHTRDGPRLELWAVWLADLGGAPVSTCPRGWTENGASSEMEGETRKPDIVSEVYDHPLREWVLNVFRSHAMDIYNHFIYPDSRAQLHEMLFRAGLAQDSTVDTRSASQSQPPGPWSHSSAVGVPTSNVAQGVLPV